MVKITNSIVINDMIEEAFNIYNECYVNDINVPNPLYYLYNQEHINYFFNQTKLINKNINPLFFKYSNYLQKTFPGGFGWYFKKSMLNENINLTDIYFDLKISEE